MDKNSPLSYCCLFPHPFASASRDLYFRLDVYSHTWDTNRVCPAFKLYWVENGQVVSIKRHDHYKPYILPQEIFPLVKRVFPNFKIEEQHVKFKDEDGDLIDLSPTDSVSFQFDKGFTQFYIYVFTSKNEAANFVLPSSGEPPSTSQELRLCTLPGQTQPRQVDRNGTELSANPAAVTNGTTETTTPIQTSKESPFESACKLVLTSATGSFHKNVFCNGCLGDVPSNRYKCLQCPNFDLCARCEAKGVHPEHLVVRVSQTFVHTHKNNLHDTLDEIYLKAAKRRK